LMIFRVIPQVFGLQTENIRSCRYPSDVVNGDNSWLAVFELSTLATVEIF